MPHKTFIDVAVELPVDRIFTYNVPDALSGQVKIGKRVLVPFGKRVVTGFCLGFRGSPEVKGIKDMLDVLDEEPIFDEKRLSFFQWMASYYFAPVGAVLSLIYPAGLNIKSRRYFFRIEQGEITDVSGLDKEILEVITKKDGIPLTSLLKTFKGKSIYSAINRLKHTGLIREELKIKGRIKERIETFVSIANSAPEASVLKSQISLSPLQAKVFAYLSEHGETALKVLRNKLGSIDSSVKKLKDKGLVSLTEKKVYRDPLEDIIPQAVLHKLAHEQVLALNAISQGLKSKVFSPFLLYGVTGSGKTLVYLKALEQAVRLGKQAIFLVPEISLTPWPVKYVTAILPGRVAVLHSGLSDGERYDEWKRIRDGEADVVVGARSAIFAPLKNLGLIIVDEEHEPSYKQEEGVRYNARDLSLMMGKMLNLTVILGSATPSVETFYNAKAGKITPLHLTRRVEDRPMPEIEVVDMKKDGGQESWVRGQVNKKEIISEKLKNLMIENHSLGYQTILFLNRRGFSNFLICNGCGHSFKCLNCSVSLTMHKRAGLLKCHYCDMSMPIPDTCPKCHGCEVKPIGIGTEQLEEEARNILKKARVARMDRDTTTKKRSHQKILDAVDKGDVDVLVGTQMVAKGHHFPYVTLVGIVSADTSINIPDFRSSERTFQLITQAGGRAGRGNIPGKVVIQTLNPDHFCLKPATQQNYKEFFREELNNRKELFYPPFSRLAIIRFDGNKEEDVAAFAKKTKELADSLLNSPCPSLTNGGGGDVAVLGPTPAILSKLKGKYRWQMLLKGKSAKSLHEFIKNLLTGLEKKSRDRVKLAVDVDPITTI